MRLRTDRLWWSVVFGANLGGNLTAIGSASTLVAVTIIHKNDSAMPLGRFIKLAIPFCRVAVRAPSHAPYPESSSTKRRPCGFYRTVWRYQYASLAIACFGPVC